MLSPCRRYHFRTLILKKSYQLVLKYQCQYIIFNYQLDIIMIELKKGIYHKQLVIFSTQYSLNQMIVIGQHIDEQCIWKFNDRRYSLILREHQTAGRKRGRALPNANYWESTYKPLPKVNETRIYSEAVPSTVAIYVKIPCSIPINTYLHYT